MPTKGTPEQSLRAEVRKGLERAGYANLLNRDGRDTVGSLAPAVEAYLEFHALGRERTLEELFWHMQLPRHCNRPDVDYNSDGEPMVNMPGRNGVTQPAARTIERFLSGDIDPMAAGRGVTFWTHEQILVKWQFHRIGPEGSERNVRRCLRVWQNICGVRFGLVGWDQFANIRTEEANLGPGILGMAQLPGRNMPATSTLWCRMALGRNWNTALFNTTLAHEYGHNLGCGHIRGGLMNPSHIPGLRTPQPQDIQWARQHYPPRGDENPNDIDLVSWSDAPAPPPTGPVPPPDLGAAAEFAGECVIRVVDGGQVATITAGQFRRRS